MSLVDLSLAFFPFFSHSTYFSLFFYPLFPPNRLPRFRDKKQHFLTSPKDTPGARGDEVPYDPPLPKTVDIWDSGPVLVANQTNRESVNYDLPGEGKILRTLEEGSRVWKHKTVRTYHEDVPKSKENRPSELSNRKALTNSHHSITAKTDDDKLVSNSRSSPSTDRLVQQQQQRKTSPSPNRRVINSTTVNSTAPRYLYSSQSSRMNSPDRQSNLSSVSHRLVAMEDKSIQCNLKKELKENKQRFELREDFKVIKSNPRDGSVSAYSDVSLLDDPKKDLRKETVVYSTVETHTPNETIRTREMQQVTRDRDYLGTYRSSTPSRDRTVEVTRSNSRPNSRSDYSPSPTRTRVVTKSYGVNIGTEMGPDMTRSSPLREYRSTTPKSWTHYNDNSNAGRNAELASPSRSRNIAHEIIEETISISNASSDEMLESHNEAHARAVDSALKETVSSSNNVPPIAVGSSLQSTRSPVNRDVLLSTNATLKRNGVANTSSRASDRINSSPKSPYGQSSSSLWFSKPVDEDYRRSMVSSPLDVTANTIGVKDDHERFCSATLNRQPRPVTQPSSQRDVNLVQSYTLDRKHLDRRKKALSTFGGSQVGGGVSFEPLGGPPGFRKAPSLPEKESTPGIRRFASTRDVSGYQSELGSGYRRGGLAAAFKERQARASSLNRSIERGYHGSSISLAPQSTSRQYGSDIRPRTRSFHDSEPEVHYVPIKTADGGAPLNRHQSILQKRQEAKLASKAKDRASPGVVTFASHGKQYSVHPAGSDLDSEAERKKKDLKRSQSMPKDTKFPWLARLKMKVKARDP